MWFRSMLNSLKFVAPKPRAEREHRHPRSRPRVEQLEDRLVLSGGAVTVFEDAANMAWSLDTGGIAGVRWTVASNTHPGLFSQVRVVGNQLTLDFAPDVNGQAEIWLVGTGGHPSEVETVDDFLLVDVLPVNDAPAFTAGPDQTNFDLAIGTQQVFGWATGLSAGPANEAGQTLTFEVTNDNNPLFIIQPHIEVEITGDVPGDGIDNDGDSIVDEPNDLIMSGTLVYTLNPNVAGVAAVFVTLRDNGGTANGGMDASATVSFYIASFPPPPPPSLTIEDVRVTEGNFGTVAATFTVKLTHPSRQRLTVDYITGAGIAVAGSDFQTALGQLTFEPEEVVWSWTDGDPPIFNLEVLKPGETSKTITVLVNGDALNESTETFFVNLFGASYGTIADAQAVGSIDNDDPLPRVAVSKARVREGHGGTTWLTFTVRLTSPSASPVTVHYVTRDGTATRADRDYVASSGLLTFAPGQTSKTIRVKVRGDRKAERNETMSLNLSNAVNASIAESRGIGTIVNDDS